MVALSSLAVAWTQLLSNYAQLLPSSAADWAALLAYNVLDRPSSPRVSTPHAASVGTAVGAGPFHWSLCPDHADDARYQCGYLTVPLDHLDPTTNATLDIAVQKYTTNVTPSLGTILVNPGGPGGPGTGMAIPLMAAITGGQYDILGFDPRGIGKSRPMQCSKNRFTAAIEDAAIADLESPLAHGFISDAEADAYASNYALPIARCHLYDGDYLPYLSTAFVARDMDLIRAALGQDLMHYYGVSYGSFLGITYANMFPQRVGRFVIDAVLDPELYTGPAPALMAGSFRDTDRIFAGFAADCEAAGPRLCALADSSVPRPYLLSRLRAFLANVTASPLLVPGGDDVVRLTDTAVRNLIVPHLYSAMRWPQLALELKALMDGTYLAPLKNASCDDLDADTGVGMAYQAYIGNDGDWEGNAKANWTSALRSVQNATRVLFDPEMNNIMAVKFWKTRAVERYDGPWGKAYANKVVILNNELDPVCPLHSAQHVRDLMGPMHSVLITRDGYGHGAAVSQPSACLHRILVDLYSNGSYPVNDTRCGVDHGPFDAPTLPTTLLDAMTRLATMRIRK